MSEPDAIVVLDLPARPSSAAVVRGALRALIDASPAVRLTSQDLDEVTVAVQEACTNVIRHACGLREDLRFCVEFHAAPDAFTVVVRDEGPAYDAGPVAMPDPEELREGGYGRYLMHAWMHDVTQERRGSENVLTLVRRYGVRAPARGASDG